MKITSNLKELTNYFIETIFLSSYFIIQLIFKIFKVSE